MHAHVHAHAPKTDDDDERAPACRGVCLCPYIGVECGGRHMFGRVACRCDERETKKAHALLGCEIH